MSRDKRKGDAREAAPSVARRTDATQLQGETLDARPFPGRGAQGFRVYLEPSVHREIRGHCAEDRSVEVGGVLVGRWERDDDGPFVRVAASIRGEGMTSKSAEVTFTHETWAEINRRMDRDFADERIVGWYHSHPDFGIFLSDRDLFIHEHFFPAPGQIAVVIDPVRDEEGVFVWQEGTLGRTKTYWVGAEPHASSGVPSVERMEAPRASEPRSGDHDRSALQPNGRGGSSVISTLLLGLALVGAMAIGMWLSGFGDRLRTMRSAEAIARQLAARTTSSESTIALSRALSRLAAIGQTLAPPPTDGTTPPAIDPAIRERLVKDLIGLERELNAALRGLDMSPEESLAIDMLLATRLKELQAAAAAQKAESEKAESEKAASEKAGGESAGTEKPAPAPAAPKGGT